MNMSNPGTIMYIAWRNVWRYPRRTILTMLTIVAGCAMILLLNSIATGGHDRMIDDAVANGTGHIQIHEKGFRENQTLEYAFIPDEGMITEIRKIPGITGAGKRIQSAGLVSCGDKTAGVLIQGVEPEEERNITAVSEKILKGGRYIKGDDARRVIIGDILAQNIAASVGSSVSVISQGFDGSIAAVRLEAWLS